MRIGAAIVLLTALATTTGCSRGDFFRQYEYEEEMYLALDGSATIYVNSSVAALNALRGSSFDTRPSATIDRDAVGDWFTTPVTHVTRRPTLSRRSGRRFVHIRVDVDDVERLSEAAPFAWSSYQLTQEGNVYVYRQHVGAATGKDGDDAGWKGDEIVAFRLHLPSRITDHNAGPDNFRRGNILVWEQPLRDRLLGKPLALEATMESQSILYRTLFLFGATFLAVAATFCVLLWWILRRGRQAAKAG